MKLNDYIGLVKKDIISFVGAGGKTTMMFKLAQELRLTNKVLVTTTTKIYMPTLNKYDFLCTDSEDFFKYSSMKDNGIYVLGLGVNEENKILGVNEKQLDELAPYFDYILIEADGAKEKQLKGWNEFEPVIYIKTTVTVGLIDIQAFGMVINEHRVHTSKLFRELTGDKEGETVVLEHLFKVIMHPQGLFKAALGKKILYINKVEGQEDLILAKTLVKQVKLSNVELINSAFIGSLKTDVYCSEVGK